jgi:ABC-2 type transport system ATP-binding protein
MAEADELCDRLAIVDRGKVLACDSPANLKRKVQEYPLFELSLAPGANGIADVAGLPGVHQATRTETPTTVELKVSLAEEPAIGAVVQRVASGGGKILSLKKVEPTLEEAFVELVGHGIDDAEGPDA